MIASFSESERAQIFQGLTDEDAHAALYDWRGIWARPNQVLPPGDWRYWLLLAGRGFGKTRVGAETVREWAENPQERILMIAPVASDVREVMIEGPSGLLNCYPPGRRPTYYPTRHLVAFPSGAIGITRSADEPERLRGPQFTKFWADEMCAWQYIEEAWTQIMFGFRMPGDLRGVITTTPKPLKRLRQLVASNNTVVTRGSSYDNRSNLSDQYYQDVIAPYVGTRIGRQEINAEILEDIPGALWTMAMIDAARVAGYPTLWRIVVALDPAVTANDDSDETGIVVAGIGPSPTGGPPHIYVLEDGTRRCSPGDWAKEAIRLMVKWKADRIIAETNNGGDLVEANLRAFSSLIPFRAVHASRGKAVRAEPVAALYEQGKVHHVGRLPQLEEQMCGFVPGQDAKSPDRMDALVWAVYDLALQPMATGVVVVDSYQQISPI